MISVCLPKLRWFCWFFSLQKSAIRVLYASVHRNNMHANTDLMPSFLFELKKQNALL